MNLHTQKVDLRSEEAIRKYLTDHFRYDTMGSHNRSTSFAHCVKIHKLGLSQDARVQAFDAEHGAGSVEENAYAMLGVDDLWRSYGAGPVRDFTERMHGRYTIGSNGRSGGYLVLYNSQYESSGYQSYCLSCGQQNYKKVGDLALDPKANKCGVCHATGEEGRVNYETPPRQLSVYPGQSVGDDLDYFSFEELKGLARVVLDFDATCLQIRENFLKLALQYRVVEKTIQVPQRIKALELAS